MVRLIGLVAVVMLGIRLLSDRIITIDVNNGAALLQDIGGYVLNGEEGSPSGVRVPYNPNSGRVGDRPAEYYGPAR